MSVICSSCGVIKKDYKELARHIVGSRKGHQKSKPWAHKFLLNAKFLDVKADRREKAIGGRLTLTDTEKENKRCCKTELSGKNKTVATLCPYCKKIIDAELPEEYISDAYTWKTDKGMIIVTCQDCR
jgi:hypothetical protein